MRKSSSDDCIWKINPKEFSRLVDDRIDIDPSLAKELFKFLIEVIKNGLMDGKIVHLESLGYFYLHIMNRSYFWKNERYFNVDSKVIVKPNFRPSNIVLARFTKRFGEDNIFEGLELVQRYEDKIAPSEIKEHALIKDLATRSFPDLEEEESIRNHYERDIKKLERNLKTLKIKMQNDINKVRRKNNARQQH